MLSNQNDGAPSIYPFQIESLKNPIAINLADVRFDSGSTIEITVGAFNWTAASGDVTANGWNNTTNPPAGIRIRIHQLGGYYDERGNVTNKFGDAVCTNFSTTGSNWTFQLVGSQSFEVGSLEGIIEVGFEDIKTGNPISFITNPYILIISFSVIPNCL